MKDFPFQKQTKLQNCGLTCLIMVSRYYELPFYRMLQSAIVEDNPEGISLYSLALAARKIGFRCLALRLCFRHDHEIDLMDCKLPAIIHWNGNHFVVIIEVSKSNVWVADPALGVHQLSRREFENGWADENGKGIVLLLEPV